MSTEDKLVNDSMKFIEPTTMSWGIRLKDIKSRFQNIIWGSEITESMVAVLGYFVVEPTVPPKADVVTEVTPILEDGVWKQQWEGREYTPEELQQQLEDRKTILNQKIEFLRNETLSIGVPFNFGTEESPDIEHIQVRDGDRANQVGMATQLARLPDSVQVFRTYQDNLKTLTPDTVASVTDAAYTGYFKIMSLFWNFKDTVKSATTMEQLPVIPENIQEVYEMLEWVYPTPKEG